MYGVRRGKVDKSEERRERWMEDLSFCLGEAVRLLEGGQLGCPEGTGGNVLFLKHFGGWK
jgi:hypothetical protein